MSGTQALTETWAGSTWPSPIIGNRPLRVGVVAAPGLPATKVRQIYKELAGFLHYHVDDRRLWQISLEVDPLLGSQDDTTRLLAKAAEHKKNRYWDYVVCVTDLPLWRSRRLTTAEASTSYNSAVLCLPSLGAILLARRLRESFVQLVNELHHGSSVEARNQQQKHAQKQRKQRRRHGLRNHNSRALVSHNLLERLTPIKREQPQEDEHDIDVRYIPTPRTRAIFKILIGMVRVNQPFYIVPTFRRILAVAFATGAYALLFKTLWTLSDVYSAYRLIAFMTSAIIAMVTWLMIDHDLWAKRPGGGSRVLALLHNLTTIITLLFGVISYYGILFAFFLFAVLMLVTPDLFRETLGHDVNLTSYILLAWLATSVSTVAGALGASLESSDTVHNATYGHRQRTRYNQATEAQKFQ